MELSQEWVEIDAHAIGHVPGEPGRPLSAERRGHERLVANGRFLHKSSGVPGAHDKRTPGLLERL